MTWFSFFILFHSLILHLLSVIEWVGEKERSISFSWFAIHFMFIFFFSILSKKRRRLHMHGLWSPTFPSKKEDQMWVHALDVLWICFNAPRFPLPVSSLCFFFRTQKEPETKRGSHHVHVFSFSFFLPLLPHFVAFSFSHFPLGSCMGWWRGPSCLMYLPLTLTLM